MVRLGVPAGDLVETRTAFMRYRGQGHEIAVPVGSGQLDPARCGSVLYDLCAPVRARDPAAGS